MARGQTSSLAIVRIAALVAGYFIAGKLGLQLAYVHSSVTPVWLPTGISLAALLIWGTGYWPGVFSGAFLVNWTTAGSLATCLSIAVGNTLEAVVGARLVNRWAHGARACERLPDIFRFTVLAGMVATSISATWGAASLCLASPAGRLAHDLESPEALTDAAAQAIVAAWSEFPTIWLTWWLGDGVGALLVCPALLLWHAQPGLLWSRANLVKTLSWLLILCVVGQIAFGWLGAAGVANASFAFACLPVLVWTAYQFGQRETATAMLLLAGMALLGTMRGHGPFVAPHNPHEALLHLQTFIGITAVTALALGALVAQQQRADKTQRLAQEQLEQRVRDRTAILAQTNDNLRQEIADRRQAQLALSDSEQRTRHIIETAFDAFIGMDGAGRVTDWNAQAEAALGWSRREAIGRLLSELIIPDDQGAAFWRGLRHYLDDGQSSVLNKRIELTARHRSGHEFPVEVTVWSARAHGAAQFYAFVHDISVRKETAEKLRQAERLAAIGEMLTGLAHESRNALQQSQACLELLALKVTNPEVHQLLGEVQKAQDHLHYLYEAVRRYAAPVVLERRTTDLAALVHEIWEQLALARRGRQTDLCQETANLNLRLHVDRLALGQVFRNILENSLAACVDPVQIRVRWTLLDRKGAMAVQASVRDNGPGLTVQARQKLFEPFFTTKTQGTGLGLAIARRIVEAHGGLIAAGDGPLPGTEILITLPGDTS